MKKILSVLSLCLVMSLSTVSFAEEADDSQSDAQAEVQIESQSEAPAETASETQAETKTDVQQWLEPALGDWYSTKGNFVMNVQDNNINGCPILGISDYTLDYPRKGTLQIQESTTRDMKLELFGNKAHQYLVVDNNMVLRRSIHPSYNESMGGIYLGMTKDDLISLYKQPTRVNQEGDLERLNYDNHKFAAVFKNNIIVAIRMYMDSDRHFDKSGLGVTSSAADYAKMYGFETPVIPTDPNAVSKGYKIDDGEFFHFSPAYVELSVFN